MVEVTRREVAGSLRIGALALAAGRRGPIAAPAVRRRPVFEFAIAGGMFHGLRAVNREIALREHLALRAEPDNPADAHTVAVHRGDGLRLGYLPRRANAPIAALLAAGAGFEAEVIGRLDATTDGPALETLVFTGFVSGDPRTRLDVIV